MKKFFISALAMLSLNTSISVLAANEQAIANNTTPTQSTSHKRIPLIIVSCEGPHIGYYVDKKGKQFCLAYKNAQKTPQ